MNNARTSGGFDVTHSMILGIALPMTLAYLTTPLLGLVDTAIAGRLGEAAIIGGLAIGAIIVDFILTMFNFLQGGTGGLTAQALGAGDEKERQAVLARALTIALVSGGIVALISPVLIAIGLYFMSPGDEIAAAAGEYSAIRMLATPLALTNFVLLGWLIGQGHAGLGLLLQLLINITNIGFSILLGLIWGYGLTGIAIATAIGHGIGIVAGLAIISRFINRDALPSLKRVFDGAALKRIAQLNLAMMLRSFVLIFSFAFLSARAADIGEVTLAANAILMHFFLFGGYFLDGFATAAEQISGRAIGARYRPAFDRAMRLCLVWAFFAATVLSAVYLIFGQAIIDLLTTLEPVRLEAYQHLTLAALMPVFGALAFHMDGVFIGATWSGAMSVTMLASLGVLFVVWSVLGELGAKALWLSLGAFLLARGLTMSGLLPFLARRSFGRN